ncbi:MAG: hypothetical protein RSC69_04725 [Lachnospiraceae bacterium]
MKKTGSYIISAVLWAGIVAILYYIFIPAVNIHSQQFWLFVVFAVMVPAFLIILIRGILFQSKSEGKIELGFIGAGGGIIIIMILLVFFGSPMFHAGRYASLLPIKDGDFTKDIDEASAVTKVALMDTDSARILGNREIGSLTEVVSQFNVNSDYSQIDYQGSPMKVSALEYAGFFKYLGNKDKGARGYVQVDPVGQNATYITLDKGMKYIPSSYFGKDLQRHIRFQYPTAIFNNVHFEIDEEGNPFYVASVRDYTIGMFGGETIKGAIVCNPVNGECKYYKIKDVPTWVDNVFYGNLLVEQYNWYGKLSGGYMNSLFGKKGCKKCTETVYAAEASSDDSEDTESTAPDYGYISKDGDIWIYTGVTSVNDDASNIGFIMVNERTGEAKFFKIPGADESSAMQAAEGEVQEKGFRASFPSLINVDGTATYIMVLKDANGIVKLYSMVNVEQYNIVVTATELDECYTKYRNRIHGKESQEEDSKNTADKQEIPVEDNREVLEAVLKIERIQYVDIDGNTYVYVTDPEKNIYRRAFKEDPNMILLNVGDELQVTYSLGENEIRDIKEIK